MKQNIETVIKILKEKEISFEVIEHDPVFTMKDVEEKLKISQESMAKTIVLLTGENDLIAVLLQGMKRLDIKEIAKILGVESSSLKICSKDILEERGFTIGAISPISESFSKVLMDSSLLSQSKVYFGSGDLRKTIGMSPQDLKQITYAIVF
jgi:prolyl-tRNA editing enzyme YbaK/EbsC (Cys-tRNA(Pro) deacylase)